MNLASYNAGLINISHTPLSFVINFQLPPSIPTHFFVVVKKVTYLFVDYFSCNWQFLPRKWKETKKNIRETSYINLIVIKTILKSLRMKNWLSHVRPIKLSPSNGIYDMRHRTLMSCQNKSGSLDKRMLWLDTYTIKGTFSVTVQVFFERN